MNDMSDILTVKGLSVSYGAIKALRKINISIYEGTIVAILGANGAGKTTLLKTISGIVSAEDGSIFFDGQDISNTQAEKIVIKGISHVPEGRQIFNDLSVYENLKIGGFSVKEKEVNIDTLSKRLKQKVTKRLKNLDKEMIRLTKEETIIHNFDLVYKFFPVLKERKNQVASTLSGGEMQMLAIGRALMGSPKLLILDEPSLGLAPLIIKDIFNIIKQLKKQGISILIVEQNALQTLKIADYAYVLQLGSVVRAGKTDELIKDQKLIEAYLG
jgi:branched-chain amino acid transport system ATP-binding protein